ncbi:S-adenosyl-L-methionine-dependent methyltransferase [Aspergillus alliaceus]|uniref:S-adenosyl-L-methionine-dependent methyltransferase n=1 Tax=Petromyces alliaceus TaxID=209559 RepID=UPI0012A4C9E4|nr:S-adenosyl-L-methionine-dependent methyltransferase [Aspergillus alliaceus]KAB8239329.1 S-adenosyl-L-methionine-dependent methyltransferase [Aspergillus alliaceus]
MILEVDEVLHHEKSKKHDILLFKATKYGTSTMSFVCIFLIIPCIFPAHSLKNGGVLREAVKHASVEEVTICENDEAIIRVSIKYRPDMSVALNHVAAKMHIGDEIEFPADNQFDIITADSLDSVGYSKRVVQKSYFEVLNGALVGREFWLCKVDFKWLHLPVITEFRIICKDISPVVEYAYMPISTYPSGQTGFLICSNNPNHDVKRPLRCWAREEEEPSFVLPNFARRALA